jgi:two-component sensor histidine kinase
MNRIADSRNLAQDRYMNDSEGSTGKGEADDSETAKLLSRELHHRVFNNLQLLSSILDIQIFESSSIEVREALRTTQARLSAIALVNEFSVAAGGTGIVNVVDLAQGFSAAMTQSYSTPAKKLLLSVGGPERMISTDEALPLAIVAAELVNFAMAPRARLNEEKGDSRMEISWSGEAGGAFELRITSEVEYADPSGLRLIEAMAMQVRAEIAFSREDEGYALKLLWS